MKVTDDERVTVCEGEGLGSCKNVMIMESGIDSG